jgi:hypothetical protein
MQIQRNIPEDLNLNERFCEKRKLCKAHYELFVLQNFFGEFIKTSDIGVNLTGSNMRVDGVPA